MQWADLRSQIERRAAEVVGMLRSVPDGSLPVEGLEWTVGELGAHLVTVAQRNITLTEGEALARLSLDDGWRAGMAARNERELADEVAERSPEALADRLDEANRRLLDGYGLDDDRRVSWYELVDLSIGQSGGIWLGELLIHGLDLARTLERGWPIDRADAITVIESLMPLFPTVARPEIARRAAGTYHVSLRGGDDYTFDVRRDGTVTTSPGRPDRADLHVSADPVPYLLVGYGRASKWGAVARGAVVAWGRKPWLARHFADLFERP